MGLIVLAGRAGANHANITFVSSDNTTPDFLYHGRMPRGDCYEVHLRFLRDEVDGIEQDDWSLCHGTVINGEGRSLDHCWLESNGHAYDFSNDRRLEFPTAEYRQTLQASSVTSYTYEEAMVNSVKHGHFGPWT